LSFCCYSAGFIEQAIGLKDRKKKKVAFFQAIYPVKGS